MLTYIEKQFLPKKTAIIWNDDFPVYNKCFVIFSRPDDITYVVEDVLGPVQFFNKYGHFIRNGPYYTEYMAYILGDNVYAHI